MEQIKTKLKFKRSEKTGTLIGFVTKTHEGKIKGVRESEDCKKKICVLSKDIRIDIEENVLYDVTLFPMHDKDGYIVSFATPSMFTATIESSVVKGSVYKTIVKFGNKQIIFDPMDGRKNSVRSIKGAIDILRNRKDIANSESVISDFMDEAYSVLKRYEADGFYVPKVK